MNHFAHGIDDPLREIVLDDLVANVVQLGQRFASQKGAELVAADLKQAPIIAGNPYLVRQALFLCLDLVLEGLPSAGTITISARSEPGGVLLLMSSPALNYAPEFDRKIAYLKIVAEELRGVAQAQILPDQTHLFSLLLPRA